MTKTSQPKICYNIYLFTAPHFSPCQFELVQIHGTQINDMKP